VTFNIGINVIETQGTATPALPSAPTSRAGFIIRSKRGIDDGRVVEVTSWRQFVAEFGEQMDDAYGAYALRGFFQNGGTIAHVTRVLPTSTEGSVAAAAQRDFPSAGDSSITAMTLTAGRLNEADPGAWGNDLAVRVVAGGAGLVDLVIRYPGVDGRDVETWENLDFRTPASRAAVQTRINRSSNYVKIDVPDVGPPAATSTASTTDDDFVLLGDTTASGSVEGDDGSFSSDAAEIGAYQNAIARFDGEPIQLLCCPETHATSVVTAGIDHCEAMGDRMYVGHLEETATAPSSDPVPASLRGDKVYGALYAPWLSVSDPNSIDPKLVPPVGHVLGAYDRITRERGVWRAPAGDAARLAGVLDTQWKVSDVDHTTFAKRWGVNLVRPIVGKGIVIDSARTLSTNPLWYYVNVRRLFNFVKTSLKDGLRWVAHEPNDPRLWDRVRRESVRPFLMNLWRLGAFGPGAPDDVFTIQIDAANNPPSNIQLGRLDIDITFYPSRPAETVVIRVGQQLGANTATEA
jgi:phage tail sheath protein FI